MPTIDLDNPDPAVLDGRHIRAAAFVPAQQQLLDELDELAEPLRLEPTEDIGTERRALTVGAGYSELPHLIAAHGFHTTATDASLAATRVAQQQSPDDAEIDYRTALGSELPFATDTFNLVWCIDTLEVTDTPSAVLAELARVLRPNGTLVLDTVNNTAVSRLIYLRLFQQVPGLRIMPRNRYTAARLVPPQLLASQLDAVGLRLTKTKGYEPSSPISLLAALFNRRRGKIRDDQLGDMARFRLSRSTHTPPVTYFAIARP